MLILTRRTHEKLRIGEEVILEVVGVQGNQVRFGITAPKNITILREEIYQRILREQQAAGSDGEGDASGSDGNR